MIMLIAYTPKLGGARDNMEVYVIEIYGQEISADTLNEEPPDSGG